MAIRVTPKNYKRYEDFMARMSELRNYLISRTATMAVGSTKGEAIIQDSTKFARLRDQIEEFLLIPNIVQDVKDYENDQAYDISIEVQPTQTELQESITLINQAFPEHNDYKLVGKLENGFWVSRVFTAQQTQGLRAAYQQLADTIADA